MNRPVDHAILQRLFEDLDDGVFVVGPGERISGTNGAALRLCGRTAAELAGRPLESVLSPSRAGQPGDAAPAEGTLSSPDGMARHVRVQRIATGPSQSLVVIRDARDLQDAREANETLRCQLVAAQRLEAVGTLAGGIAHDFNNMLGGILGFASFSKSLVGGNERLHNAISAIETTALRASALTRQLLGMVRGRRYEIRPTGLNEMVGDVVRLLARTVDPCVMIETRIDEPEPHVSVDEGQMQQVLLNVCINARDAMPDGGRLRIETGLFDMDERFCRNHQGARPGRYGFVAVSDTGTGMNAETLQRIFEPFFTTKGPEAGTGLGLAMVWSIVKNHGGYLTVRSEPRRGSTFTIYLPYAPTPARQGADDEEPEIRRGHEHILVVDDEAVIRDMVEQALEAHGYRVTTCAAGAEALAFLDRSPDAVDLVMLDRIMPAMDGRQVLAALRASRPDLRVVLMTGSGADLDGASPPYDGIAAVLTKPFRIPELCRVIQGVLEGAAVRDETTG